MNKELPLHLVEQIRNLYVDNDNLALADIASESKKLLGKEVDLETLRYHARSGRWGVLKRRKQLGRDGLPQTIGESVTDVAQVVYDTIMDPDGLTSPRDLAGLVSAFITLQNKGNLDGISAKRIVDMQAILNEIDDVAS